ncbi:MAG: hypothetical protein JWP94_2878 [Mucilaginibacter sp.]|nr:hypothetical protein [Mucilaginibacter sp.]
MQIYTNNISNYKQHLLFLNKHRMMADSTTLIEVSAFSGLAGALLTQIINTANGYFIDKRKQAVELKNAYRNKKIEIGESFYYMAGEKMAIIKKTIRYWKNWNKSRTADSISFLKKEISQLNKQMEALEAENWKYSLISIYFNVSFISNEIIESNERTHRLYLKVLDLTDKINRAENQDKEMLHQEYAVTVFDMCSQYEKNYSRLEHDRNIVKEQLLKEFSR